MTKYVASLVLLFALVSLCAQGYEWSWVACAGGINADLGTSIATDNLDTHLVTGFFNETILLGPVTLTSNGGRDVFVAKLDGAGNYLWAVKAGGTGNDKANSIAVDTSANIYITGQFEGIATFGSLSLTSSGGYDVFTAKLDPNGNFLWAVQAGGSGYDSANAIEVDIDINLYLTGRFEDSATFGCQTLTSNGGYDVFAAKLDPDGSFLWAVKAGGVNDDDSGLDISVAPSADIYISGRYKGTASFGAFSLTSSGGSDIFAAKLDSSGNFLWAVSAGGINDYDQGTGIASDDAGHVYLAGFFYNTAHFGPIQLTSNGYTDVFAAKLDGNGNFLWAAKAGGIGGDQAWGIALDASANVYLTGFFFGTATFGSSTVTSNGFFDIFAAKLDTMGNWSWALSGGSANDEDVGYGIAADAYANVYLTGCYEGAASFGPITLTNNGSVDIFVAKLTSSVLADDNITPVLSDSFLLSGSFPNPFKSEIAIQFNLDRAQAVQAGVYNLKGELIRKLVNGSMPIGGHSIFWKGNDNQGRPVGNGVYYIKIQTPEKASVRRIVLVK